MQSPFSNKEPIPPSFLEKYRRNISSYVDATLQRDVVRNKVIVVWEGQVNADGNCSHSGSFASAARQLRLLEKGWEIRY